MKASNPIENIRIHSLVQVDAGLDFPLLLLLLPVLVLLLLLILLLLFSSSSFSSFFSSSSPFSSPLLPLLFYSKRPRNN